VSVVETVSLDSVAVLVAALAHARAELAGVTAERDHWRGLAERAMPNLFAEPVA